MFDTIIPPLFGIHPLFNPSDEFETNRFLAGGKRPLEVDNASEFLRNIIRINPGRTQCR